VDERERKDSFLSPCLFTIARPFSHARGGPGRDVFVSDGFGTRLPSCPPRWEHWHQVACCTVTGMWSGHRRRHVMVCGKRVHGVPFPFLATTARGMVIGRKEKKEGDGTSGFPSRSQEGHRY
jgi:hypothetical protein